MRVTKTKQKRNSETRRLRGKLIRVFNPESRRLINLNGYAFKRVLKLYEYNTTENKFIVPQQPLFDGKYWQFNETTLTEEVKNLIVNERTMYGQQKKSKYLKMDFFNNIVSLNSIYESLDKIYQNENNAIKLNIAFGYVTIKEEIIKLVKPGRNYFFNQPITLKNASDLTKLKRLITQDSILEQLTKQFPDSKTQLLGIYAMAVKITRLDYPIGNKIELPPYIIESRSIIGLHEVDNNMCFWACLALATGCRRDRYKTKAAELYTQFYSYKPPLNYAGFDYINELDRYENSNTNFAINIVSYYEDKSISYIRKSKFNDSRTSIYLNLYLNHFSYITDLQKLAKTFLCQRCDMKFRDNYDVEILKF